MGFALNKKVKSSKRRGGGAVWSVANRLRDIDSFGKEIPSFNLRGENRVNSVLGGVVTTLILTLTLIYASLKVIDLVAKKNPVVVQTTIEDEFSQSHVLNFNEVNHRFAFSVEGVYDRKARDDSRYVKWIVRITGDTINGELYEKVLPHHKCTEDDYSKFYPINKSQEVELEDIKNNENRGLYCVDQTDEFEIFGDTGQLNFQMVTFDLVPCNYVHSFLGYTGDSMSEDCVADLEEQLEYLGPTRFKFLVNQSSFNQQGYEDEAIHKNSFILGQQLNAKIPSYIDYQIQAGRVNDEADLVQVGQVTEHEFYGQQGSLTPQPSAWITYPTPEDPGLTYKFIGLDFNFSKDLIEVNRQTYSLLDWMGDIGGLIDGLFLLADLFMSPLSRLALQGFLMTSLVRVYPRSAPQQDGNQQEDSIMKNAEAPTSLETEKPETTGLLGLFCGSLRKTKRHKLMIRANAKIERQLDLGKFFDRQRVQMLAALALLTPQQAAVAASFSKPIVPDHTGKEPSSSDSEDHSNGGKIEDLELAEAIKRIERSTDMTDRRLVSLGDIRRRSALGQRTRRQPEPDLALSEQLPERSLIDSSQSLFTTNTININGSQLVPISTTMQFNLEDGAVQQRKRRKNPIATDQEIEQIKLSKLAGSRAYELSKQQPEIRKRLSDL